MAVLLFATIFLLALPFIACHAKFFEVPAINTQPFDKLRATPTKSIFAAIRSIERKLLQKLCQSYRQIENKIDKVNVLYLW